MAQRPFVQSTGVVVAFAGVVFTLNCGSDTTNVTGGDPDGSQSGGSAGVGTAGTGGSSGTGATGGSGGGAGRGDASTGGAGSGGTGGGADASADVTRRPCTS